MAQSSLPIVAAHSIPWLPRPFTPPDAVNPGHPRRRHSPGSMLDNEWPIRPRISRRDLRVLHGVLEKLAADLVELGQRRVWIYRVRMVLLRSNSIGVSHPSWLCQAVFSLFPLAVLTDRVFVLPVLNRAWASFRRTRQLLGSKDRSGRLTSAWL